MEAARRSVYGMIAATALRVECNYGHAAWPAHVLTRKAKWCSRRPKIAGGEEAEQNVSKCRRYSAYEQTPTQLPSQSRNSNHDIVSLELIGVI